MPVKFSDFMTPDFGKLLFPRLQPDQQQREVRNLLFAILAGLAIAGTVALVMLLLARARLR
jgi:hypothetical protein